MNPNDNMSDIENEKMRLIAFVSISILNFITKLNVKKKEFISHEVVWNQV